MSRSSSSPSSRSRSRLVGAVVVALALAAASPLLGVSSAEAALPSVPRALQVDQIQPGAVRVTWQAPANEGTDPVVSYAVTVGSRSATVPDDGDPRTDVQGTSFEGLDRTTYTVSVTATGADGTSPAATTSITLVPLPSAPRELVVTGSGPAQVTVTFEEPADAGDFAILNYQVGYNGPDRGDIVVLPAAQRRVVIGNLVTPGPYAFSVSAVTAVALGASARAVVTVAGQGPPSGGPPAVSPVPAAPAPAVSAPDRPAPAP
ncbi:MAG: hypothetical protein JWL64_1359, partial [Frankiales bacterium]|nr:hypothetical protein [Frankiales bacterium]